MLELTKKPHTEGFVIVSAIVPEDRAQAVEAAIQDAVEPMHSIEEIFPDFGPGDSLAGARHIRGLSQSQLAKLLGVHKTNISEMERGKRTITLEMAKRLGEVLDAPYKTFL